MQPHQKSKYLQLLELNTPEAIATEFELGSVTKPPESHSKINESFTLHTTTGDYHVSCYVKASDDPERAASLIEREINFTKYLEFKGFSVPHHLGFQPFLHNGKPTVVTTLLRDPHMPSGILPSELMGMFGEFVAKLHLVALDFGRVGAILEQRNNFRDRVQENMAKIIELTGVHASTINALLDRYEGLRKSRELSDILLPRALTVGELTFAHVLYKENVFSVVDLEGLKFTPVVFDFGQLFCTTAIDNGALNADAVSTFLTAYQKIRPLTSEEKSWIPQEIIYNYLHKLEWRMLAMLTIPEYVENVKSILNQAESMLTQLESLKID